jgi:hypothetical protein
MTAILGPLILRHPEIKDSMEAVIVQHVLPEFQSQEGFMRYIVCFSFFSEIITVLLKKTRLLGCGSYWNCGI